jgi:hypothetical protein
MKKDAPFFIPLTLFEQKIPGIDARIPYLSHRHGQDKDIEKSLMIDYHLTATYIPANISDGIR